MIAFSLAMDLPTAVLGPVLSRALRRFDADFRGGGTPAWAPRFNATAKALIEARDHGPLIDFEALGPDAAMAINSAEHYLPLLYVLGAATADDAIDWFNDDVFAGISMTSVVMG